MKENEINGMKLKIRQMEKKMARNQAQWVEVFQSLEETKENASSKCKWKLLKVYITYSRYQSKVFSQTALYS